MKKLLKQTSKTLFNWTIFWIAFIAVVYAANTITTVTNQTINSGDSIWAGWYQSVNDKLVDTYSKGEVDSKNSIKLDNFLSYAPSEVDLINKFIIFDIPLKDLMSAYWYSMFSTYITVNPNIHWSQNYRDWIQANFFIDATRHSVWFSNRLRYDTTQIENYWWETMVASLYYNNTEYWNSQIIPNSNYTDVYNNTYFRIKISWTNLNHDIPWHTNAANTISNSISHSNLKLEFKSKN